MTVELNCENFYRLRKNLVGSQLRGRPFLYMYMCTYPYLCMRAHEMTFLLHICAYVCVCIFMSFLYMYMYTSSYLRMCVQEMPLLYVLCVYMNIYISFIPIYAYVYICSCLRLYIHELPFLYVHMCVYICMRHSCICICIHMYIQIYVVCI